MNKILAFDSMYFVKPIRKVYMALIGRILNEKSTRSRLVLYRLDHDNVLIRDERNVSATAIGAKKNNIDAMSIKFYRYLDKSGSCDGLLIKNLQLYNLPILHL